MHRVLHLVQAPGTSRNLWFGCGLSANDATDAALLACRAAVEGTPEFDHSALLIASSDGEFRADALGLARTRRVTATLGVTALARRSLSNLLESSPRVDIVQCWNEGLVQVARRLVPTSVRVLTPPDDLPIPPAGTSARLPLRALMDAKDDTPVIGLVCDPPHTGDAHRLQFATGLFDICGLQVVGVVPSGASHTLRGRRFHRETGVRVRTVFADYPALACLPACDAVFLHRGIGTTARLARSLVLAAHSHGVPVIAAPGDGFEHRSNATSIPNAGIDAAPGPIVSRGDRPADLARAMLVLLERGLPAVRAYGNELRAAVERSGEAHRRLGRVRSSWMPFSVV